MDSGALYGTSGWSDDEEQAGQPDSQEDAFEVEETAQREGYLSELNKAFGAWRRLQVDWATEFPQEKLQPPLDAVNDLMDLDVGKLYGKLERSDPDRKVYGYLPLMASCCYGQIGALNAESFCERTLRAAGHVLTEGRTLLSDDELEMLVILRMNREFMEFMREHYADLITKLAKQHFGCTVVDPEEDQLEPAAPCI